MIAFPLIKIKSALDLAILTSVNAVVVSVE